MDYSRCLGRYLTESVYMSHHIVAPLLLFYSCGFEVIVCHGDMIPHLLESLVANVKTELILTFGKPNPELPPSCCPSTRGEELQHLLA